MARRRSTAVSWPAASSPARRPTTSRAAPASSATVSWTACQMNAKGTYLLDLLGSHVLKAGADVELLSYDQLKAFSGGVTLREAINGASWQDYRRYGYLTGPDTAVPQLTQRSTSTSTTAGGFLQDSWTIADRVTINAGVRYDTQCLYGGDGSLAFVLANQLSPRIGVVVDPMANGRMKVYANFARYYEQVPLNLLDRAFPAERRYNVNRTAGEGLCDRREHRHAGRRGHVQERRGDCHPQRAHQPQPEPPLHRRQGGQRAGGSRHPAPVLGRVPGWRRVRAAGQRPAGCELHAPLHELGHRGHEPRRRQHVLPGQPGCRASPRSSRRRPATTTR